MLAFDQTRYAHLAPRASGTAWRVLRNVGDLTPEEAAERVEEGYSAESMLQKLVAERRAAPHGARSACEARAAGAPAVRPLPRALHREPRGIGRLPADHSAALSAAIASASGRTAASP